MRKLSAAKRLGLQCMSFSPHPGPEVIMKHHRRPAGRIGRCSDRRRLYLQRRCGAGRMWASVRLLKQRRAFMTEIMSTETVLVKSIKSTCHVKHLMEKDHPRRATLILLVSRGSRGSWVSEPLGV
jgi:hypothetical protein